MFRHSDSLSSTRFRSVRDDPRIIEKIPEEERSSSLGELADREVGCGPGGPPYLSLLPHNRLHFPNRQLKLFVFRVEVRRHANARARTVIHQEIATQQF